MKINVLRLKFKLEAKIHFS